MKVLLIEDSTTYREFLRTELTRWNYAVQAVSDAETALPIISSSGDPLILVVDWELPGMSGLELVAKLDSPDLRRRLYAIILTARESTNDLAKALNAGADDYLVKPFQDEELKARLHVAERTLALHQELVAANEKLESLAREDPLTELLNRRAVSAALERERLRAKRKHSSITLIMCDLDHFKQINDGFGHTVGDNVLRFVARALKDSSRGSDLVARIGGDEFLLVLPGSDTTGAETLVARVQKHLASRAELPEVLISLSFGIAEIAVSDSEREALQKVDTALYKAKRNGRNCASGV